MGLVHQKSLVSLRLDQGVLVKDLGQKSREGFLI